MTLAPPRLLHRQRLAGDHRLVDRGVALDHDAVHRDRLARPHQDQVADLHFVGRDFALDAVAEHTGHLGLQLHQLADGLAGAAARDGLQVAAEDDEGGQQRGGFEEGGLFAAETGVGEDGVDDRDDVRRADAGGVEQVHVGDAVPQPAPGVGEELPARARRRRAT